MFEKALDACATSPFARSITQWVLAGKILMITHFPNILVQISFFSHTKTCCVYCTHHQHRSNSISHLQHDLWLGRREWRRCEGMDPGAMAVHTNVQLPRSVCQNITCQFAVLIRQSPASFVIHIHSRFYSTAQYPSHKRSTYIVAAIVSPWCVHPVQAFMYQPSVFQLILGEGFGIIFAWIDYYLKPGAPTYRTIIGILVGAPQLLCYSN